MQGLRTVLLCFSITPFSKVVSLRKYQMSLIYRRHKTVLEKSTLYAQSRPCPFLFSKARLPTSEAFSESAASPYPGTVWFCVTSLPGLRKPLGHSNIQPPWICQMSEEQTNIAEHEDEQQSSSSTSSLG